jgi:lipid II:glycine glycyltransferase (peptidoglycan interpeptide bridge formation enzyme)
VREGIVAEFAHLNPWADGKSILQEGAAYDRDIVWVDTTLTPESLWASHIDHACRKNIGKAQRAGLRSVEATSKEDIREFLRIYSSTMARKNALESYRFSLEYFEAFQEKLPEGSRFTLTMAGDHIAGALLVLFDDENAYSYLGGTDAEFHHLRPSNFATWELIQWAHAGGKKRVVLGGGYRPDDGIFRFKATFSNLRQPFHVYKKIHLPDEYSYLEQENRNVNGITESTIPYFPSYRYVNS